MPISLISEKGQVWAFKLFKGKEIRFPFKRDNARN